MQFFPNLLIFSFSDNVPCHNRSFRTFKENEVVVPGKLPFLKHRTLRELSNALSFSKVGKVSQFLDPPQHLIYPPVYFGYV